MRNENGERIILEKAAAENYKMYLERTELYKRFGYDIEAERKFLIDKTEPLYGDILEVGTGKGYLAVILAKEGHNFISLDISEEEQKFARLHLKHLGLEEKVDFKIGNAENLSFADKSFDIVISSHLVHHLDNPFKVIGEFIRVVSYEGKIILSDFSKEGLEIVDKVHQSEGRRHQASPIGLKDIEKYFQHKGFNIEGYQNKFQDVLVAYHPII